MESVTEKSYEECGVTLNEIEQTLFVQQGKCKVYRFIDDNTGDTNVKSGDTSVNSTIIFWEHSSRLLCLQKFLAFHSETLMKEYVENADKFMYLVFSSDLEIVDAMIHAEKYKDKVTWKHPSSFTDAMEMPIIKDLCDLPVSDKTKGLLRVNRPSSDSQGGATNPLFVGGFESSFARLFVDEELPWTITNRKTEEQETILLSRHQRNHILSGNVKCGFYLAPRGTAEPCIEDSDLRIKMFHNTLDQFLKQDRVQQAIAEHLGKVMEIQFRNGDKDIFSVSAGLWNPLVNFKDPEDYKDSADGKVTTQAKEDSSNGHVPMVILVFIPESEKVLESFYTSKKLH